MAAFRGFIPSMAAVALTTGCYFETIDDRAPGAMSEPQKGSPLRGNTEGNCHYDLAKGCFDGYVLSEKDFFIDGKQFFNADTLASEFADLVTITDAEGNALTLGEDKDYTLTLTSGLDNRTFLSEFTYNLTGTIARRDEVKTDGNFSVNDLPEGSYDLRVQRPVRFDVVRLIARDPADPDGEPQVEKVKTSYCATIYADTVVEIRRGSRTWDTFGDFQLHVADSECSGEGNRTTVSLPD